MRELWSSELTQEETERLLHKAVTKIRGRKLEVPAILFAEMSKPLANLGGHAAVVFSPFLIPFFGFDNVNDYSQLISKRDNWERLIRLLEEPAAETRTNEG